MSAFCDSDNIYLRPLSEDDVPLWTSWFNDPVVTSCMNKGFFPVYEHSQLERLGRSGESRTDIQLAVIEKQGDRLIGTVGIHKIDWIHRTADISVVIGDSAARGKGYGTESVRLMVGHAFRKLNLNKLTGGMWSANTSSEKCFINNGFSLEGRKREQYYCDGEFVDELCYGLLKEEWDDRKGK